jgi:hypothetical protein
MTEPTELEKIAHLSYLDELVGLREGWEKLAARKKKDDATSPRRAIATGYGAGGAAGLAAGVGAEVVGAGERGRHLSAVRKQEQYVKRLRTGLSHAKAQKKPSGVMPTVAVQNLAKQRKDLTAARAALKRLKSMKVPPRLLGAPSVGLGLGAAAGGTVGAIRAYQQRHRAKK